MCVIMQLIHDIVNVHLLASGSCVMCMVLIKLGNMKHCIKIVVSKQSIESLYNSSF